MDLSDVSNYVTALLAFTSLAGLAVTWRRRQGDTDGYYKLLGWASLFAVTGTVWLSRMAHSFVEPRSLITPFVLVGWTFCTILVLTLFIATIRRTGKES